MIQLKDKEMPAFTRSPVFRRIGPTRLLLVVLLLVAVSFWVSTPAKKQNDRPAEISTFESKAGSEHSEQGSEDAFEFWDLVGYAIHKADPNFGDIKRAGGDAAWHTFNADDEDWHHVDNLEVTDDQFRKLKLTHQNAIKDSRTLAPRLPYNRGTRGIVTSCANDAITIATTSLRMLRMSGSQLPVEVVLDHYEEVPCEVIFPSLGAKCVFIEDRLPKDTKNPIEVYHFMNKAMAVLLSSFEQVLYLDSDLFPVTNPDSVFITEPFISKHFITWPDYWALTASHIYYDIAGREQPAKTAHASTESGALFINKAVHAESLLLALVYNAWGDKYWYRLFSQGAQGEGDKETWQMAIETLRLPSYRVNEPPGRVGYRCDGRMQAVASAQHHPHDDWLNTQAGIFRHSLHERYLSDGPQPRVLFIHGNLPKYDSPGLINWKLETTNWLDILRCGNGTGEPHRLWGPKELTIVKYGWDVEKAVWDSMRWAACEHEFDFSFWVNGSWHSEPKTGVCAEMERTYPEILPGEIYEPELPKGVRKEQIWGARSQVSNE